MKKVLFITYYWPPAGGATVNRIFKFSQYLPDFGWEPVILTTEDGDFPFTDESLLKEVDPKVRVYRSAGLSLHKIFKKVSPKSKKNFVPYGFTDESKNSFMDNLSRWIKYNFIPDTRFPWYFRTAKKAIRIVRDEKIDLIFSSSPPQTNHMIARRASKVTGVPWVADFRDPWTDVFWLLDRSRRMKFLHRWDQRIEKKTISRMDALVTVGPSLVRILQRKTDKPIHLITNGYDHRYFNDLNIKTSGKFRVIYAGSLSREEDPTCFFNSLTAAMQDKDFREDFEMLWLGNFPTFLTDIIDGLAYKDKITFSPYTFYKDSLDIIASCELLLLIIPRAYDNECILTSKLFDYMGVGRPIIAYGPVRGDAHAILDQTGAGKLFDYEDAANGTAFILETYRLWKSGQRYSCPGSSTGQFSRKNLTGKLAEVFDRTYLSGNNT